MNDYLTIKELCDYLKVSRGTVQNWRKEGMPYNKIGRLVRFEKDKVYEWLKNKEQ